MRKLLTLTAAVLAVAVGGIGTNAAHAHLVTKPKGKSAEARLKSQTENLKHAQYVCNNGKKKPKQSHCRAIPWLTNERQATLWEIRPPVDPYCWSENPNVALGNKLARDYGWHTGGEWCALYLLWNHESGWSEYADNPISDACGIPQRMDDCANAGHNPYKQIVWGLNYIDGRYGSPSGAYSHLRRHNWY